MIGGRPEALLDSRTFRDARLAGYNDFARTEPFPVPNPRAIKPSIAQARRTGHD